MAESEENIRETEVTNQGDKQVVREKTQTNSSEDTQKTVGNAVWYVAGFIEVLLAFRFVLKLFGANPGTGFVSFVYSVSGFFTAPFRGIFSSPTTQGDVTTAVFEWSTLVAMAVYGVVAWGIVKLVNLNRQDS